MAFGGNVFEPEVPVEVVEEAEKRANADAALEGEVDAVEAARAEAWTAVEELHASLEENGSLQTFRVRKENGANAVRFRGGLTVSAGKEVKTGETLFKLPVAFRPSGPVQGGIIIEGQPVIVHIPTNGKVTLTVTLEGENSLSLDEFTFNLT